MDPLFMKSLFYSSLRRIARAPAVWSAGLHATLFSVLLLATIPHQKSVDAVRVGIVSIPPISAKHEKKAVATERKIVVKKSPKKIIQGLAPSAVIPDAANAVTDNATHMAVPIGNTLLAEDEGKRMSASEYQGLAGDLSADARLIRSSIQVPKYTDDALEANLEGNFIVDVYVDESGKVLQSEVRKRIGFGMDERLLEAARIAKFNPRKNKSGRVIAGWAEIKFTLLIP